MLTFLGAPALLSASSGQSTTGCGDDVAQIGSSDYVRKARKELGIQSVNLVFQKCEDEGFSTSGFHGRYVITYQTLSRQSAYKAPIIHELAHVFQFERAGTPFKLLEQLESSRTRVELGADFIAGVVYGRLWPSSSDAFEYQSDISVLGSFHGENADFHGTTVDRVNAFRLGFFVQDKAVGGDIWKDHQFFQQSLFQQFETHS